MQALARAPGPSVSRPAPSPPPSPHFSHPKPSFPPRQRSRLTWKERCQAVDEFRFGTSITPEQLAAVGVYPFCVGANHSVERQYNADPCGSSKSKVIGKGSDGKNAVTFATRRKRPRSDAVEYLPADIPKPLKVKKWGGEAARELGLLDALPQMSEVERPKKKRRVIDSAGAIQEEGRRGDEQETGERDDKEGVTASASGERTTAVTEETRVPISQFSPQQLTTLAQNTCQTLTGSPSSDNNTVECFSFHFEPDFGGGEADLEVEDAALRYNDAQSSATGPPQATTSPPLSLTAHTQNGANAPAEADLAFGDEPGSADELPAAADETGSTSEPPATPVPRLRASPVPPIAFAASPPSPPTTGTWRGTSSIEPLLCATDKAVHTRIVQELLTTGVTRKVTATRIFYLPSCRGGTRRKVSFDNALNLQKGQLLQLKFDADSLEPYIDRLPPPLSHRTPLPTGPIPLASIKPEGLQDLRVYIRRVIRALDDDAYASLSPSSRATFEAPFSLTPSGMEDSQTHLPGHGRDLKIPYSAFESGLITLSVYHGNGNRSELRGGWGPATKNGKSQKQCRASVLPAWEPVFAPLSSVLVDFRPALPFLPGFGVSLAALIGEEKAAKFIRCRMELLA